ncbi:Phosphatidylethanolamine-binding protein 1 [Strongyloides ratti]|uniref:Phosphatidylethanolamine-binding protein 1 n=1 Tax=Strongyloides ratti TaxID=34506 RepID=A0A090MYR3_STRRB|nr:Phosphatidylethanolamine-binding protein 1 [Strongyloides ratti]CEF67634.1 Phosphatidylethanolamine-binding protein 1 [Strongyloides ratti]
MLEEAFIKNEISPGICDIPKGILKVKYENCIVDLGNELTPTQVKDVPTVTYDGDSSTYYTLVMTDPDAPSRGEPTLGEVKHWLIMNIPGNNINDGEIIADYRGSGPPKGTSLHRYIFLLYKQKQKINTSNEIKAPSTSRDGRLKWNVKEFSKKYDLEGPIYGNFYQAQYDDYVPILQAQTK